MQTVTFYKISSAAKNAIAEIEKWAERLPHTNVSTMYIGRTQYHHVLKCLTPGDLKRVRELGFIPYKDIRIFERK